MNIQFNDDYLTSTFAALSKFVAEGAFHQHLRSHSEVFWDQGLWFPGVKLYTPPLRFLYSNYFR